MKFCKCYDEYNRSAQAVVNKFKEKKQYGQRYTFSC